MNVFERRGLLKGALALIPILPIVVGFVLASQSVSARESSDSSYTPLAGAAGSAQLTPVPPYVASEQVAILQRPVVMRDAPGGSSLGRVSTRDNFGSPVAMWVVATSPGWLGVISPIAGNGHVGWIPSSAAQLTDNDWQIKVSLSARRLTVIQGGSVLKTYTVAVGMSYAPTPTGRFAVTDRLSTGDPSGPYGCCILALSAKSPHAIQGWGGGNRIAIHSTPETSSIGEAASHGCLRLTIAEGRWLLDHVPLGTPTLISS